MEGCRLSLFLSSRSLLITCVTIELTPHTWCIRSIATLAVIPVLIWLEITSHTTFLQQYRNLLLPLSSAVNILAAFLPPIPVVHSNHNKCNVLGVGDREAIGGGPAPPPLLLSSLFKLLLFFHSPPSRNNTHLSHIAIECLKLPLSSHPVLFNDSVDIINIIPHSCHLWK